MMMKFLIIIILLSPGINISKELIDLDKVKFTGRICYCLIDDFEVKSFRKIEIYNQEYLENQKIKTIVDMIKKDYKDVDTVLDLAEYNNQYYIIGMRIMIEYDSVQNFFINMCLDPGDYIPINFNPQIADFDKFDAETLNKIDKLFDLKPAYVFQRLCDKPEPIPVVKIIPNKRKKK